MGKLLNRFKVHHYITKYVEDGILKVTSWLQFGDKCFSVRTKEI